MKKSQGIFLFVGLIGVVIILLQFVKIDIPSEVDIPNKSQSTTTTTIIKNESASTSTGKLPNSNDKNKEKSPSEGIDLTGIPTPELTVNNILWSINNIRSDRLLKLKSVKLNPRLTAAAQAKLNDIIEKKYWSHTNPQGKEFQYFIKESGYVYSYAGENLAEGFSNTQDVVNAWTNSPTHLQNILKPEYTETGIAIDTTHHFIINEINPKTGSSTSVEYSNFIVEEFANHQ